MAALLATLALCDRPPEAGALVDAAGRRVRVSDGDTLKVGGEVIRLFGIDAVELGQFCHDAHGAAWSCGISARTALEAVVARGGLVCSDMGRDRYGRTVARCAASGVEDVGETLVRDGWAVDLPGLSKGCYAAAERAAREGERGIWAGTFDKPWDWRRVHAVGIRRVE